MQHQLIVSRLESKEPNQMKYIKEIKGDKNRVFDLQFSSKQKSKLDMLVNTLQKTFKQSKRGSFDCSMFDEREYYFSVKGYKRVNTLIGYFVTQMPRVKWKCFEKSTATQFLHSIRKTQTK
jgi:hypothetical protein